MLFNLLKSFALIRFFFLSAHQCEVVMVANTALATQMKKTKENNKNGYAYERQKKKRTYMAS